MLFSYLKNMIFKTKINLIILCLIAFILAAFIIRTSMVSSAWVTSGSMLPTYDTHERILSNQLAWGLNIPFLSHLQLQWATPLRGEVILFHNPHDNNHIWMKRVIGVAGDRISFIDHGLYINGILCNSETNSYEQLPRENGSLSPKYKVWFSYLERDWGPIIVPPQSLFVMGDNRGSSLDSRSWGTIPISALSGQPFMRIWPLKDITWLDH